MKINLPHIAFEITDACNLNCIYCYNVWKIKSAEHQSFNSYEKAIQTLQRFFQQADVKSIAFTGGEPFLAERFIEVVLFCRMEGKQVTIISNGNRMRENECKQLLKMGVNLFEFPVHSVQAEIHDQITEVKGSWEKSLTSLKTVMRFGGYVVPVVVITRYNVKDIGKTLEFINSLGCRRIMLNRYNIGGKGCENPLEISANAEELRHAFAIANTKAEELGLILSSNVCSPICLLNPKDYPFIGFGHCSFNVLQRPITLDINGNIRLCNHSPVVAGNIWKQSIEEILFSDYASSWETSVPALCTFCFDWEKCKGGCRAASEQCLQTLSEEDPIIKSLQLV